MSEEKQEKSINEQTIEEFKKCRLEKSKCLGMYNTHPDLTMSDCFKLTELISQVKLEG